MHVSLNKYYKTDLDGGSYSEKSSSAVKGSGRDLPVIILQYNYGGRIPRAAEISKNSR